MTNVRLLRKGISTVANTIKIYSWNVNGLRAVINKGAFEAFIKDANPDILCIQETKAKQGQAEIDLPEYEELWNSAERPGYSGTAILTKIKPLSVYNDLPTLAAAADEFGDRPVTVAFLPPSLKSFIWSTFIHQTQNTVWNA